MNNFFDFPELFFLDSDNYGMKLKRIAKYFNIIIYSPEENSDRIKI